MPTDMEGSSSSLTVARMTDMGAEPARVLHALQRAFKSLVVDHL